VKAIRIHLPTTLALITSVPRPPKFTAAVQAWGWSPVGPGDWRNSHPRLTDRSRASDALLRTAINDDRVQTKGTPRERRPFFGSDESADRHYLSALVTVIDRVASPMAPFANVTVTDT
jgi:hypothetical protein